MQIQTHEVCLLTFNLFTHENKVNLKLLNLNCKYRCSHYGIASSAVTNTATKTKNVHNMEDLLPQPIPSHSVTESPIHGRVRSVFGAYGPK